MIFLNVWTHAEYCDTRYTLKYKQGHKQEIGSIWFKKTGKT